MLTASGKTAEYRTGRDVLRRAGDRRACSEKRKARSG